MVSIIFKNGLQVNGRESITINKNDYGVHIKSDLGFSVEMSEKEWLKLQ